MQDETCYDFTVHGASSPADTSPFGVVTGESYNHFYYAIPWPAGTIGTRYGVVLDEALSVHAWAFGVESSGQSAGAVQRNVTGTLLGENARLLGAWATGGCNVELPADVGLQLPAPGAGKLILLQWHHLNTTGSPQNDTGAFRICTAPAASRAHLAGITLLGTENLNGVIGIATGSHQYGGQCPNDSAADITIVGFDPHMHRIGVQMTSAVNRAGGGTEVVFEQPFDFEARHNYRLSPPVVLHPGDTIRSTCTFDNDTGSNVSFGQSVASEMCFQFAIAYPTGALDNGVPSLVGATNTCW